MSRREGRDSHSKRLHSRSDRDSSPKRSRRDGKQAIERTHSSNHHWAETLDRDHKHQKRLQDALPLEIPPATETKVQPETMKEGLDKKVGLSDGTKHSVPTEVPRSRSYFQHDERGHGGRSFSRRATDPKEQSSERCIDKVEHRQPRGDDKNVLRHDGFYELETKAPPHRKRPAFREKKIEGAPENAAPAENVSEPSKLPSARGHHTLGFEKKPDRAVPRADERHFNRGSYQSRERLGRDRFNGRSGDGSTHRAQADKWKHDLYDEANKAPTPMNEEEQIAKVEALLAL